MIRNEKSAQFDASKQQIRQPIVCLIKRRLIPNITFEFRTLRIACWRLERFQNLKNFRNR